MADYKVSLRYATSLLQTANEKKSLDTTVKDMEFVAAVISSSSKLQLMLESPVVKSKIKISVLEEIFSKKISEDSLHFLLFVIEKNREDLLHSIIKKFLSLKDDYLGIVNVQVKTALEFTDQQVKLLKDKFESILNKKVRFNFEIDQSIIGGFVARTGDTVYDASISNQLNNLRKQFIEGSALVN